MSCIKTTDARTRQTQTLFGLVWLDRAQHPTLEVVNETNYATMGTPNGTKTIVGTVIRKNAAANEWLVHLRPGVSIPDIDTTKRFFLAENNVHYPLV
jgi:hypothetical protein